MIGSVTVANYLCQRQHRQVLQLRYHVTTHHIWYDVVNLVMHWPHVINETDIAKIKLEKCPTCTHILVFKFEFHVVVFFLGLIMVYRMQYSNFDSLAFRLIYSKMSVVFICNIDRDTVCLFPKCSSHFRLWFVFIQSHGMRIHTTTSFNWLGISICIRIFRFLFQLTVSITYRQTTHPMNSFGRMLRIWK